MVAGHSRKQCAVSCGEGAAQSQFLVSAAATKDKITVVSAAPTAVVHGMDQGRHKQGEEPVQHQQSAAVWPVETLSRAAE